MFTLFELKTLCLDKKKKTRQKFNSFLRSLPSEQRVSTFLVQQKISDDILLRASGAEAAQAEKSRPDRPSF